MPTLIRNGFTIIELLVVMSIIGILGVIGFANYQTFAATQVLNDAVSQTQSLFRTAQASATSSVLCNGSQATDWHIAFDDSKNLELQCTTGTNQSVSIKVFTLPANVSSGPVSGGICTPTSLIVFFSTLLGKVSFADSSNCVASAANLTIPFTFSNGKTSLTKSIIISKGGGIDTN